MRKKKDRSDRSDRQTLFSQKTDKAMAKRRETEGTDENVQLENRQSHSQKKRDRRDRRTLFTQNTKP